MTVEQLIKKLSEVDPGANVVLEGEREDICFCAREVVDDDNGAFVMLTRGKELPVRVDA